jgi:hypothetical protein
LPTSEEPGGSEGGGDMESIDLESIGYMELKRKVIACGVPKGEANAKPSKAYLKELALKHGCKLRFV